MKETLASFELSKLAKEKGFQSIHTHQYIQYDDADWRLKTNQEFKDLDNDVGIGDKIRIAAPTLSLLQKWVREVHKVHIVVDWEGAEPDELSRNEWAYYYGNWGNGNPYSEQYKSEFNTYEEALEAGLLQYIKTINDGK